MHNQANSDWTNHVHDVRAKNTYTTKEAMLAVLMDVRNELRRLNSLLHIDIPTIMHGVRTDTAKPTPKRKARPTPKRKVKR